MVEKPHHPSPPLKLYLPIFSMDIMRERWEELKESYKSSKTQILIVALAAFCCPGIFNALTGLGNAGSNNPTVANDANTALYASFSVFGYFGGLFFNLFGNRVLMGVGGLAYCFYAICQYVAGIHPGLDWLAILSGATLGVGAGLFWTAQGAMMMAYATPDKKGTYISIFWIIFNLAGLIGGLISFGLNFYNPTGQASPSSYFVFSVIMFFGSCISFFCLLPPNEVRRDDGLPVIFCKHTGPITELHNVCMMGLRPTMIFLTPLFVASNWFYTYQFNCVNGGLFTVRSRGLNSALYWTAQMFGAFWFGQYFLDNRKMNKRQRALWGLAIITCLFTCTYIIGCYLQVGYMGGFDNITPEVATICPTGVWSARTRTCRERLDVAHGRDYLFPVFEFLLYGMNDAMLQTYSYWIMGSITDSCEESARFAGFYKGIQSVGAAISWSIDNSLSGGENSWLIQFCICWGIFTFSLPFVYYIVYTHIIIDPAPIERQMPRVIEYEFDKIHEMEMGATISFKNI